VTITEATAAIASTVATLGAAAAAIDLRLNALIRGNSGDGGGDVFVLVRQSGSGYLNLTKAA
jgi:hypothetical protein